MFSRQPFAQTIRDYCNVKHGRSLFMHIENFTALDWYHYQNLHHNFELKSGNYAGIVILSAQNGCQAL